MPGQKGNLFAMGSTFIASVQFCSDTTREFLQLQLHCMSDSTD